MDFVSNAAATGAVGGNGMHLHQGSLPALILLLSNERLQTVADQSFIQDVNTKIETESSELAKVAWICRNERAMLQRLINVDPAVSHANVCQLMVKINEIEFVPAYKAFKHYSTDLCSIFRLLHESPAATALLLNSAQKDSFTIDQLVRSIFDVIYGSCIFPDDEKTMFMLLGNLIPLQLTDCEDPRKILRKGGVAFSRMYKIFSEQLYSAKIFLTAALHGPIIFLLTQDELFLDIDPSNSPNRFPSTERKKRFGTDQNSNLYKERLAEYRQIIIKKLVSIGQKFMRSIQSAMTNFPLPLGWLVKKLFQNFIETKHISRNEAILICTDFIFTYFLCPAIINPEPLGIISDTPISHIARTNLIQLGKLLQTLAILPYEEAPSTFSDLIPHFKQNSMPDIVQTIVNSNPPSIESIFPPTSLDSDGNDPYRRRLCLGTLSEINTIQTSLKSWNLDEIPDAVLRKTLKSLLKKMPENFVISEHDLLKTRHSTGAGTNDRSLKIPESLNGNGRLKSLADKFQMAASKGQQKLMQTSSVTNLLNLQQRIMQNQSTHFQDILDDNAFEKSSNEQQRPFDFETAKNEVYVFSLFSEEIPIGLRSEDEIMRLFRNQRNKNYNSEKKTRFLTTTENNVAHTASTASDDENDDLNEDVSLSSSSDDNIGDDEVEDISTLPDNLSERSMPISADVSVRGSPSLSGRDTPFSNANGQNEAPAPINLSANATIHEPNRRNVSLPIIPVTIRKQNTEEGLEEKFGKFGLPPQDPSRYRDETVSVVSDSWSTDVVASDNEGFAEARVNDLATLQQPSTSANTSSPLQHQALSSALNNTIGNSRSSLNTSQLQIHPLSTAHSTASSTSKLTTASIPQGGTELPYFDPNNLTHCKAFLDSKRKLRMVLSTVSTLPYEIIPQASVQDGMNGDICTRMNQGIVDAIALNHFLNFLLAESINNQDRKQSAQIREVQRCLALFDAKSIRTLLRVLKDEHRKRTHYQLYLQQSRMTLLQQEFILNKLINRMQREKTLIAECLIEFLTRFFLNEKENFLRQFVAEFQYLNAQDERIEHVEANLKELYEKHLLEDNSWRLATSSHLDYANKTLERSLMAHIYYHAMFPNDEADALRDEVFHKSLQRLSAIIQVDHPDLAISKNISGEAPWPDAQQKLRIINAYKSPRDKMVCIVSCCETIESLIILSSERTVSADDILPVLVFVILKANPPNLLSTIQYIDGFYAPRMHGSESYWWTHFNSAVEFLKQLLNNLLTN